MTKEKVCLLGRKVCESVFGPASSLTFVFFIACLFCIKISQIFWSTVTGYQTRLSLCHMHKTKLAYSDEESAKEEPSMSKKHWWQGVGLHGSDDILRHTAWPVTFTAPPTKQWAGTFATVLKSKKGNSISLWKLQIMTYQLLPHGKLKIRATIPRTMSRLYNNNTSTVQMYHRGGILL